MTEEVSRLRILYYEVLGCFQFICVKEGWRAPTVGLYRNKVRVDCVNGGK